MLHVLFQLSASSRLKLKGIKLSEKDQKNGVWIHKLLQKWRDTKDVILKDLAD